MKQFFAALAIVFAAFFANGAAFATLPSGYTELEYIGTNKNAYIVTDLTVNDFERVTARAKLYENASGPTAFAAPTLFGSSASSSGAYQGKTFRLYSKDASGMDVGCNGVWAGYGSPWSISTYGKTIPLNTMVDVDVRLGNGSEWVKVDEVVKGQYTQTVGTLSNTYPVSILAHNLAGTFRYIGHIDLVYITFYSGDTIVRNFVPAKRNNDNAIGMYETVNGVFYPSSSGTAFTAGPEATQFDPTTMGHITYNMNGGTNYNGAPTAYTFGTGVTIDGMPTRAGYTFTGWTGDNGNTPQLTVTIGTDATGDKSYTANWSQCTQCTNTTSTNCTIGVSNNTCTYTTSCKTGYGNIQNNGAYNASCTPNVYTISYNMNGGTNYSGAPTQYTYGTTTYINGTPTNGDKVFLGWCTDSGLTSCASSQTISSTATGNKTFYAKWGTNVTVTYSCGDGTGTPPTSVTTTSGTSFTAAANPCTREGYAFAGWLVSGTSTTIGSGAVTWSYTEDKTLTAQWFEEKFSATTVSLSANTTVYFKLSAIGTFYVDWGDGTGQTIVRTGTSSTSYSHKYTTAGVQTIRFGGRATGYNTGTTTAAISFYDSSYSSYSLSYKIKSVSGSLSAMFPYISGNTADGAQPRFYYAFYNASNLTTVPDTLFEDYTIGSSYMFYYTFYYCTGLTSVPARLFNRITTSATYMFGYTFSYCSNLAALPADGLFAGITNASTYLFYNTFRYASNLSSYIPPATFAGLTANGHPTATQMFYYTFNNTNLAQSCSTNDGFALYETGYEGTSYTGNQLGGRVSCIASTPYDVTYSCGNGTGTAPTAEVAPGGGLFTPAANTCTKTGYSFAGWAVSGTNDVRPAGTAFSYTYDADKTFTATWEPLTYNITLNNVGDASGSLEPGYTKLDYIGTNKNAYIMTDLKVNDFDRVTSRVTLYEFDTEITPSEHTYNPQLFGASASSSSGTDNAKHYRFNNYTLGYGMLAVYKNTSSYYWTPSTDGTTVNLNTPLDMDIKLADGEQWIKINENLISSGTVTGTITNNYNVAMFALNFGGAYVKLIPHLDCEYMTFYLGDTIVRNFVPAKRDSDNAIGMYETVNGVFYPSSTSAGFTAGPTSDTVTRTYTYTYGVGATITASDASGKEGYTFAGWCTDSGLTNCAMTQTIGTSATGDKEFWAKWTEVGATSASITYTMDGGTNYSGAPAMYVEGAGTTIDGMPTRDGYVFTGWTGSNGNTPQLTVTIGTDATGDKSYTANWSQCTACVAGNATSTNCSLSVVNNTCTYTTSCKGGYGTLTNDGAYNASCSQCAAGTASADENNTCTQCTAGTWAAAGAASCTTCPTGYTDSAAGSDDANDCYLTTTAKKYVAETGAGEVDCTAGGYCAGGATIYVGGTVSGRSTTGGMTVCATNTYSNAASSSCSACATANGYGNSGGDISAHAGVTSCTVTCGAGKYVSTSGGACVNVGAGYYAPYHTVQQTVSDTNRGQCGAGLTTIGYGAGADEAGDCGRIAHFGDSQLYLRSDRKTEHTLNIKVGDKIYYGNMSPENLNMSDGATRSLKAKIGETTYSVYDDSAL